MNKIKLRYVATCHGKRTRTKENIAAHREFANSLINFDVDFFEANTQDLGNWGGMIGLVNLHLEAYPDLPEDGYLACFEDDRILLNEEALLRAIDTLENESKNKNLAYVGHGTNLYNGNNWKACQDWKDRMGKWAKWTDGGLYVFKNSKLIEIKNKLKVLPGKTSPDGTDIPLDRNSDLNFKETIVRIWEHEVGFPTRLSLHGYEIFAIEDQNFVRKLNESYEENED